VIYEPLPNGRLRLVGADFLVLAADWHARHNPTGMFVNWHAKVVVRFVRRLSHRTAMRAS
jgi:hypothetical protein